MIGLVDGNNFFVSCERVFDRRREHRFLRLADEAAETLQTPDHPLGRTNDSEMTANNRKESDGIQTETNQ